MIKGVIFDLDGTLIDSMNVWNQVDRDFLKECGIEDPPEDISKRIKTMTIDDIADYFIDQFGLECGKDYIIRRIEELVRIQYEKTIPLKPDVMEVLDYLDRKGIPYGVATATYKNLALAVMKRCGILERVSFLLTDKEYPVGKTEPDIFLGAAERLGFAPEEIIVAEDSLHCVKTAVKAGFFTVGVYDKFSAPDWEDIKKSASASIMRLGEICNFV